ncbi:MAG: hypothetical protein PVH84_01035 [Candidatus Aminicenantes bacterium]
MRKFISSVLVFSIITLYGNLFATERRGANIEIYKRNSYPKIKGEGTPWETSFPDLIGELIAVKDSSLLLKDAGTGTDLSVKVAEIKVIKIAKKSNFLKGVGIGFIGGAAFGAFVGFASGDDRPGWIAFSAEQKAAMVGLAFGVIGIIIGGIYGATSEQDETIQIEGRSDSEINSILYDLGKKARVPNFQ